MLCPSLVERRDITCSSRDQELTGPLSQKYYYKGLNLFVLKPEVAQAPAPLLAGNWQCQIPVEAKVISGT